MRRLWPRLVGTRSGDPRLLAGLGPWPVDPRTIADRAALVRAFEYLSVLRCGTGAKVWNHVTIAAELRRLYPNDWQVDRYNNLLLDQATIDGLKVGKRAEELERAWSQEMGEKPASDATVDLAGVTYVDAEGKKLSKSTGATGLRELRRQGKTPADIRRVVGLE